MLIGAQATARLAALLPLKSCRWRLDLVISDKSSSTNRSDVLRVADVVYTNTLFTCATSLLRHLAVGLVHLCCVIAAQPATQNDKQPKPDLPDISELSPHLQQEWHPDNNALLGNIRVRPQSGRKVLWSCPNCPAGCPHIWTTTVQRQTKGTQCPYCQGRKLCKHNSLATKAPKQARYWDHSKNVKPPEQTLAGSTFRADWKCPDCQHEWQAKIATRATNNSGCPHCSRSNIQKSNHPTFQVAEHTLSCEWDHERNAEDGIYPHNTKLQSMKLVHWVCHKCPKGQLHRYQMPAYNRTGRRSHGCPYCASHKVCDCNSLAACEPTIAAEWDFARNEGSPAGVTSGSRQVVWWRNDRHGSWQQRIDQRTESRCNST